MANEQAVIYAAPNGSGTACTLDSPCSLATARDKVRTINNKMTGDIVVYLRGGTYALGTALALASLDSGTNGFNVIYKAYPGEIPMLSGGQVIKGWELYDRTKNIYKAVVGQSLQTRQLFVNGVRAVRARGEQKPPGFTRTTTGYTKPSTGVYANMQSWGNITDIELVGLMHWRSYRVGVSSISGNSIILKQPAWGNTQKMENMNQITWIENAYELLDSEGEFYLNRSEGAIYYKPRANEDMMTANVVAPVLEFLVNGTGTLTAPVHNIQFYGITFAYATNLRPSTNEGYVPFQAGYLYYGTGNGSSNNDRDKYKTPSHVTFSAAVNIRFERNSFIHLGGFALNFEYGSQNNVIIGNRFQDISGTAVTIGHINDAGESGTAVVKNNTVSNNYITDIGLEYHDGVAVFAGFTDTTVVNHNEINNLPYTGVTVGWGWTHTNYANLRNNSVTNNLISNFMKVILDGGGVYMLSRQDGTVINNNYIHHNNNEYGTIYLDQGCENISMDRNVLAYNFSNYIFIQDSVAPYAFNNTVTNTFVNNGTLRVYSQNKVSGTVVSSGDNWSSAALAIMEAAGLEKAYVDIKNPLPVDPPPVDPPPTAGTNIALNKPATSSSAYSASYTANKANDGDIQTIWSTTSADMSGWWQVDLGEAYALTKIEIVSRQDLNQEFARINFEIRGSNTADFKTFTVLGSQGSTPFPFQGTWSLTLTGKDGFRYLRVVGISSKSGMNFAEFRAYGDKTPETTVTNIALRKPAIASSAYSKSHTADKGNDGDAGTLWSTTSTDKNGWWQVDLGASYTLTKLEVVARQDLDQAFARINFEIRGSNTGDFTANYSVLGSQGSTPFPNQGTWSVSLPVNTSFRYLRLVVVKNTSGMNFAEFRAFGF